jgi:hypothetical protein
MTTHTITDTSRILAKIASMDRRTVGETDIMAWHEVLGDLDPQDCLNAVATHRRESTEWLMPVHVRRIVADIVKKRLHAARVAKLRELVTPDGTHLLPDNQQQVRQLMDEINPPTPWWDN